MMLTGGLGSPQDIIVSGLRNPYTYIYYSSSTVVSLPIPERIKDAYPFYFGSRPKDEHKTGFRFGDIVGSKPNYVSWLRPDETFIDTLVEIFDRPIRDYVRAGIYSCVNERLYQAFLRLNESDVEGALNKIDEMVNQLRLMIDRMKKEDYDTAFTFYLDVNESSARYGVNVSVFSTKSMSITVISTIFRLGYGRLDIDYLG